MRRSAPRAPEEPWQPNVVAQEAQAGMHLCRPACLSALRPPPPAAPGRLGPGPCSPRPLPPPAAAAAARRTPTALRAPCPAGQPAQQEARHEACGDPPTPYGGAGRAGEGGYQRRLAVGNVGHAQAAGAGRGQRPAGALGRGTQPSATTCCRHAPLTGGTHTICPSTQQHLRTPGRTAAARAIMHHASSCGAP